MLQGGKASPPRKGVQVGSEGRQWGGRKGGRREAVQCRVSVQVCVRNCRGTERAVCETQHEEG